MIMEKEKLTALVNAAKNGDMDATNELFNAFYNDIYYFALKTVKDNELALDITQEAFVDIINGLGSLSEPAAFVTWAKQITYHQCTKYFRKKKEVLLDEDEEGNTIFDTLKEENSDFIPDEALDKADFKKTVMEILDELSEEQRAATMMYYFDEMSVKQIAEIQGVSEGTVKSRLNYARKTIKNSVEEYEKKHNIKLHAIPFFPLFKWLFEGSFDCGMPIASAEVIAQGVTAATGTAITVSAATTGTAAVVAATTATAAAAVGIGAKIAAIPVLAKVIAGIAAASVIIGGTTAAVILSKDDAAPTDNQSVVSEYNDMSSVNSDNTTHDTESSSSIAENSDVNGSDESSHTSSTESYDTSSDVTSSSNTSSSATSSDVEDAEIMEIKNKFSNLSYSLKLSGLSYFSSPDNLAAEDAFWYTFANMDESKYESKSEEGYYIFTIPISDINAASKKEFGRIYNYSKISNAYDRFVGIYNATYIPATETEPAVMYITAEGGGGDPYHPEIKEYVKIDDTTYQLNIVWYDPSSEKPTDPNVEWYFDENDNYTYWIACEYETMILKYKSGHWIIQKYTKA